MVWLTVLVAGWLIVPSSIGGHIMEVLMKGDRVYHRNLREFGVVTEVIGGGPGSSSIVLFDDGEELEITTSLLVKINDQQHEDLLKGQI